MIYSPYSLECTDTKCTGGNYDLYHRIHCFLCVHTIFCERSLLAKKFNSLGLLQAETILQLTYKRRHYLKIYSSLQEDLIVHPVQLGVQTEEKEIDLKEGRTKSSLDSVFEEAYTSK